MSPLAPSLANRQPWRWLVDRPAVRLYADWSRQGGDAPPTGAMCCSAAGQSWITARWRFPRRAGARGCGGSLAGRRCRPAGRPEVVEQPPARCTSNWPRLFRSGPTGVGTRPAGSRPPRSSCSISVRRGWVELAVVPRSPHWVQDDGGGVAPGSPRPQMTLTTMRSCWCWVPARTTTRCGYAPGGAQSPHVDGDRDGPGQLPAHRAVERHASRPDWPARCSTARRTRRPLINSVCPR